jgi:hypothetical protein
MSSTSLEDGLKLVLGWLPCLSNSWKNSHSNLVVPKIDFIAPQKYTFESFISNIIRKYKDQEIFEMIVKKKFFFIC